MMTPAQRADLDRYMSAIASGGATVLSNASRARKLLAELPAEEAAPLLTLVPSGLLYPRDEQQPTG